MRMDRASRVVVGMGGPPAWALLVRAMEYWGWAEGRSTIRLVMGGGKAIESFRPDGFGPTGVEPSRFVCLEDLGRRRGHPASPPMRDEAAPEWGTQFVADYAMALATRALASVWICLRWSGPLKLSA